MMWCIIQRVVSHLLHLVLHVMVVGGYVIMVLMSLESWVDSRPQRVRRALELRDLVAHFEVRVWRQFGGWDWAGPMLAL
jgi:hypothetical protein